MGWIVSLKNTYWGPKPWNPRMWLYRILVKWSSIPQSLLFWDRLNSEPGVCKEPRANQEYPDFCFFYLRVIVHAALTLKVSVSPTGHTVRTNTNGRCPIPHYPTRIKEKGTDFGVNKIWVSLWDGALSSHAPFWLPPGFFWPSVYLVQLKH